MAVGLPIVGLEIYTRFVQARLGTPGHVIVVGCGVYFSIWGLKEVIAGWLPWLGRAGLGRDQFLFPTEGILYVLIMIAVFAGSMIGRSNPLMLVFSLMAAPLIMNGWLTKTLLHRLTPERKLPQRVMAGEPVSVEVNLRNGKSWLSAWLILAIDTISNDRESFDARTIFARIPPAGIGRGRYLLRLTQRGVYRFGPIKISTRFPLGLVERGLSFELPDRILVYPRLGRLTPGWKSRLRDATELASVQNSLGGTFNDEFHKLRDYRRGDDHRTIHWKTSARQNELIVQEYRQSRDQELALLLDAWLPARPGPEDHEAVELAISLAASVATEQCRHGRETAPLVVAGGREFFFWGGATGGHRLESLLDGLALLQPAPLVAIPQLFEMAREKIGARERLLLVSSRPENVRALIEAWAAERPQHRLRFLRSLDILNARDPQVQTLIAWS